jgi:hypothetical protein
LAEGGASDVLGGHDELAIEFEGVVEGGDVGVREASVNADLTEEAVAGFGVAGGGAGQGPKSLQFSSSTISYLISDAGLRFIDDAEEFVIVCVPGGR